MHEKTVGNVIEPPGPEDESERSFYSRDDYDDEINIRPVNKEPQDLSGVLKPDDVSPRKKVTWEDDRQYTNSAATYLESAIDNDIIVQISTET